MNNNNNENRLTEEQIVSVLDDRTKEEFNELLKMRERLEKEFDELMKKADIIGHKLDAIDSIIDSTIDAVEEAIREEKRAEAEKAEKEKSKEKARQAKRDVEGAYNNSCKTHHFSCEDTRLDEEQFAVLFLIQCPII